MADKLSSDVFKCSLPNSVISAPPPPQSYWSINLPVSVCFTNTMQVFSFHSLSYPTVPCFTAWSFWLHDGSWMWQRLGPECVCMVWGTRVGCPRGNTTSSLIRMGDVGETVFVNISVFYRNRTPDFQLDTSPSWIKTITTISCSRSVWHSSSSSLKVFFFLHFL